MANIGDAITALKLGKTVYREAWAGNGSHTTLRLVHVSDINENVIMAFLWNGHITSWLNNQDDLLAADWIIQ